MTAFLLTIFFSFSLFADETFLIRPYLIVSENNNVTLIFKTAANKKMSVVVNNSPVRSGVFKKNELQKFDVATLKCGQSLNYQFRGVSNEIILDRGTFAYPCQKSQKFYFGFISDTQIKDESAQVRANELTTLVAGMKKDFPFSVILNAGDIVQYGGRDEEWINFFKTADPYLKSSYLLSAIGNHEYYESEHDDVATPEFLDYMRDNHSSQLGNVAVDVGPVTILVLNSNFKFLSEGKIQEQWAWLEEKLRDSQSRKRSVFISMHHSPFSSSVEHFRDIPVRLRKEFVPLVEKYSCVKMVLTGHLHMYERSFKNNIHYLVAGPSGGVMNVISYKNPFKVFLKSFVTTFTLFEMNKGDVLVKTYDTDKNLVDFFNLKIQ